MERNWTVRQPEHSREASNEVLAVLFFRVSASPRLRVSA
jgi:hypothetical protein